MNSARKIYLCIWLSTASPSSGIQMLWIHCPISSKDTASLLCIREDGLEKNCLIYQNQSVYGDG